MTQRTGNPGQWTLPISLTPFIGRQREVAEIEQRLANPDCRLLTIIGPGGTGKTRLAMEVASHLSNQSQLDFPDGIFWSDLQEVMAVDLLATAVADALSLPQSISEPQAALLNALENKRLLLVLDNFEQLRAGAAVLTPLLKGASGVKMLVTSREALNLREEWLFPLAGLPVPPDGLDDWPTLAEYDAVRLFVAQAQRLRPSFRPEDELAGIVQICRLVEGLPLALEMAAAWARALDSAAIAGEIQRSLGFLTAGAQNVTGRHRSMQTIFDHTWTQLNPEERAAFGQMAVFSGGFRREAAEAVVGAGLAMLTNLVDRSLLRWEASGRYQMHELLRQYATARAEKQPQELAAARARHADYYARFLNQLTDHILGARQLEATKEISAEMGNIRSAWHWAIENGRFDLIGRSVESLAMFYQMQSRYQEAQRLFAQVVDQPAASAAESELVTARVLAELGWFRIRLGQFEAAEASFERCQAIFRRRQMDPPLGNASDPVLGFSMLAAIRGEYERATCLAKEALATATRQQNMWSLAMANYCLASAAQAQGDFRRAQQYATDAYAASEITQDRWFMAYCQFELGQAAAGLGDYSQARHHFTACYTIRELLADPEGMALAMNSLGDIAVRQTQYDEAASLFGRSLAIYRKINDRGGLAAAHHGLGLASLGREDYEEAGRQLRQALQIASDIRFTALQLAVLADAAVFLLRTGRLQPGLRLLVLVSDHPATNHQTRNRAAHQLRHYRRTVSTAVFDAANPPDDLEAATGLALIELLAPVSITAAALPPAAPTGAAELVEPLTEREMEVLQHLALGRTNQQIAEALTVVVGTIKAHNNRIYGKLGVSNRTQAIGRARELGLIA